MNGRDPLGEGELTDAVWNWGVGAGEHLMDQAMALGALAERIERDPTIIVKQLAVSAGFAAVQVEAWAMDASLGDDPVKRIKKGMANAAAAKLVNSVDKFADKFVKASRSTQQKMIGALSVDAFEILAPFAKGTGLTKAVPEQMSGAGVVPEQVGGNLTRRQVHDIGVQYGQRQAIADELVATNWENPFANRGPFGQGLDDIYVAPDGSLVVVEYKGGTAGLAQGQMSLQWVDDNITKLIAAGDPMGTTLRRAMNQGNLSGITYSTSIKDGVVQATRVKKVTFY